MKRFFPRVRLFDGCVRTLHNYGPKSLIFIWSDHRIMMNAYGGAFFSEDGDWFVSSNPTSFYSKCRGEKRITATAPEIWLTHQISILSTLEVFLHELGHYVLWVFGAKQLNHSWHIKYDKLYNRFLHLFKEAHNE